MKIIIRADHVHIEGYVNAVERLSKPITERLGTFRERVKAGTFRKAINRAEDIRILSAPLSVLSLSPLRGIFLRR